MFENRTLQPGIAPRKHLFLDTDNLIEWDVNIIQRVLQAEKVAITGLESGPPGSWDGRNTVSWGSVLVEDGLHRMWYCCMPDPTSHKQNIDYWLSCYAESEDGIHWHKPDLKITGQNRYPGNNLLPLPGCVMSVVYGLPDAPVKYLAATVQIEPLEPDVCDNHELEFNGNGTYLFGSDDGLHWRQLTKRPIIQHGDWCALHVDRERGRYLLYQKVAGSHGLTPRRVNVVIESKDGIHWEGYEGIRRWRETFVPDDYDDMLAMQNGFKIAETYNSAHYQVGPLHIALQNLILVGLPLNSRMGQNPNGASQTRVCYSRDGVCWRYPQGRRPFLEVGKPGDFDAGFIAFNTTLTEFEDEHRLYYNGLRYPHGWCIDQNFQMREDIALEEQRQYAQFKGLARIKRDRFAGLGTAYKGRFDAEAGTRQGSTLAINARCPQGYVRVAIAEQRAHAHVEPRKSEALPGFGFDDCIPITGDGVNLPVRFRDKSVAEIPANLPLVLRFEVMTGEVFAYEWNGSA
jgi:hypothetical protein